MRNGQNKRMRGRNRKGQNPLTRVYESNGPDVKIRGTASHVADKYVQLARDAHTSGDPVAAENYYQHAEHYFRVIAAVNEQFRQSQPFFRDGESQGGYEDGDEDGPEQGMSGEPYAPREQGQPYYQPNRESQPYNQHSQHNQPSREPQPYMPREARFPPRDREQAQPYQPRPQAQPPQPVVPHDDAVDVDRLPAFVTGGAPQPAPTHAGHGQNGPNGPNGFEGAPDRFPLHRRRRRRHGPREGQSGGDPGEGSPRTPSE